MPAVDPVTHVLQRNSKPVSPGTGFSDHNKSWLKRKAKENHSDDELEDPSGSDSQGTSHVVAKALFLGRWEFLVLK